MIDPDQLPDPKAAKVLKGFDVAEPGDGIQELDRRWRETLAKQQQQNAILEISVVLEADSERKRWLWGSRAPGEDENNRSPRSSVLWVPWDWGAKLSRGDIPLAAKYPPQQL